MLFFVQDKGKKICTEAQKFFIFYNEMQMRKFLRSLLIGNQEDLGEKQMAKFEYEIKNHKYKVCEDEGNKYIVYRITEEVLPDGMKGIYNNYLRLLAYDQDIKYAKAYINQMFFDEGTSLIDGALINSSIQLLVKCFTNPRGKGRPGLNPTKVFQVYANEIGEKSYLEQYNQFYEARRTALAHDQKDYLNSQIGLTVIKKNGIPLEITCIQVRSNYLYKQNADIMKKMLEIVSEYVNKERKEKEQRLLDYFLNVTNAERTKYKEFICGNIELSHAW